MRMAQKSKSLLLPLLTAAAVVLAALGGLVFQKIRSGRAAKSSNAAGSLDDKTKEWISEVVATPRQ
jgi:hypothetical protein